MHFWSSLFRHPVGSLAEPDDSELQPLLLVFLLFMCFTGLLVASGFHAHRLFFSPVFMRKAFIPYSKVTEALCNYTIPTTHIYKYHQFAQKVCHKYSCPSCFKNRMSTIYKQKTVKQITHTHNNNNKNCCFKFCTAQKFETLLHTLLSVFFHVSLFCIWWHQHPPPPQPLPTKTTPWTTNLSCHSSNPLWWYKTNQNILS